MGQETGFAHAGQREVSLLERATASPKRTLAAAALAVTLLTWGSAFPGIRSALRGYGPADLALGRFLVASAALAIAARFVGIRRPARSDVFRLVLAGALGITLYHVLLNLGERTVTAGSASLVIAIMPPLTALGAALFLGERLPALGWAGIAVSLAGVALISIGDAEGVRFDPGVPLIATAAAAFAAANVIQKPLLSRYTPFEFAAYATWSGTLLLLVFTPQLVRSAASAPAASTVALLYLGAVPAAVGGFAWSYVLRAWSASVASASLLLIPVVATCIAWLWLGEVPAAEALAGGAVVLAGVVLVRLASRAARLHAPSASVAPVRAPAARAETEGVPSVRAPVHVVRVQFMGGNHVDHSGAVVRPVSRRDAGDGSRRPGSFVTGAGVGRDSAAAAGDGVASRPFA